MKLCIVCSTPIKGRSDKKFCAKECSNKFHAVKRKNELSEEVGEINSILLKNRRILKSLFSSPHRTRIQVPRLVLAKLGFNFHYITGIYINRERKTYHYVYDLAWMEFSTQEILVIRKSQRKQFKKRK